MWSLPRAPCLVMYHLGAMRFHWPLVLMYHAVVPAQPGWSNVDLGVVYQEDLERQLRYLKRWFGVLHPEEYAEHLARGRPLPRRAALVTVDDGYQNLLDYALPVARAVNVVPLAFVSTGHLDATQWLWFARVCASRLLGGPDLRPLFGLLGTMTLAQIEAVLLERRAPRREDGSPLTRLLYDGSRAEDLARHARSGALCLGGHTVSHPNLPREAPEFQRREIEENRRELERLSGAPVRLFAYPSGDIDANVARCLRDAGYHGAFSILPAPRSFPVDLRRYHIPRTGIYTSGRIAFALKCAGVDYWRWKLGLVG